MIPVTDMIDHVQSLCRSHAIGLFWCRRPDRSYSMPRACDEITVAPIKSVVSYAVALHILGRHQESRQCIVREYWAWDWRSVTPSSGHLGWRVAPLGRYGGMLTVMPPLWIKTDGRRFRWTEAK